MDKSILKTLDNLNFANLSKPSYNRARTNEMLKIMKRFGASMVEQSVLNPEILGSNHGQSCSRRSTSKARYTLSVGFRVFTFSHHFRVLTLVVKMMRKRENPKKLDAKTQKHA